MYTSNRQPTSSRVDEAEVIHPLLPGSVRETSGRKASEKVVRAGLKHLTVLLKQSELKRACKGH